MTVKIHKLTKYYGKTRGIENFNLELNKGEIFGLIGPNGAGKSTTIRSIMNLLNKNEGKVFIEGEELTRDNIKLKEKIGYLPSEVHLYCDLNVKQMLDYHASFYKKDLNSNRKRLCDCLKIEEDKKIEDLSLGNLKKVGIVLAFMHEPELVILDEATSGLDPIMQRNFYSLLKEEKRKGTTIIYSTHILKEVADICDRVGIVKDGQLIKTDSVKAITDKRLLKVKIEAPDLRSILSDLDIKTDITNNSCSFNYDDDINKLIQTLNKYQIERINIEEPSIEDVFMHYYR